jgi:hypothetical protein
MFMRFLFLFALALATALLTPPAAAEERTYLGYGRLFTNDYVGDGRDRWRSGAYQLGWVRGPDWTGELPRTMGEILEYRFRSEIVTPSNLARPDPADRRYAGVLAIGVHTHVEWAGFETRLGADLVAVGPGTGVDDFHRRIHEILSLPRPDRAFADQIGDAIHPTASAELGRSFALGESGSVRPFFEVQAGIESLLRVGGDLSFGNFGRGALMMRDVVTGQRFEGVRGNRLRGLSLTLGGDLAHVFDSALLPDDGTARMRDTRERLRAGLHWRSESADVFYGVTWLGREFEGQPEGQVLGSLKVNLRF